jgi:small subunit ribosomal protein S9
MSKIAIKQKYFEGVGRRKTAIARVRFYPPESDTKNGVFTVNAVDYKKYFPIIRFQKAVYSPLKVVSGGAVEAKVKGGGIMAQSESITLGLGRALIKFNPDLKKELRTLGYLTRDARMVERKKYGLKKARRAPQWGKR